MNGQPAPNPWLAIWLHPRRTIQTIVETNPERYVMPLAALAGIPQALDRASLRNAGDELPLPFILGASLGGGVFGGLLGLFLLAFLLRWTGKWIGGRGNTENLRAAIAWSSIPSICALLFWVLDLYFFGKDMFTSETPRIAERPMLYFSLAALEFTLAIWGLVLFIKCVAQVQCFSAWRAIGNVLLAILAFALPIVLIAFAVHAFRS